MNPAQAFGTIEGSRAHTIADGDEGSFFLAVQSAGAAQGTLLFIGSGVLADSLAKVLSSQGMKLQRAASDHALASARTHAPALVVLAGDAARDRGLSIRTRLEQLDKNNPLPVLVILAPELGGLATQPLPRHVGYLAPTGGVNECARRVQAVVELFMDEGLAACSLQQLADTVTPRGKAAATETTATKAIKPSPETGAVAAPAAPSGTVAAEPTPLAVQSKAAPPPLKISHAAATPDKLDIAVSSAATPVAVSQSKAAPPPLKVSRSPATPAVAESGESSPSVSSPNAVESKLSGAAALLSGKSTASMPAASSSKAAASAFSSATGKAAPNPFAHVETAAASSNGSAPRDAAAISGKLDLTGDAQPSEPAWNAQAALLFEAVETSAGIKRLDAKASARAAASPRQPTAAERHEAQTAPPPATPSAPEKTGSNSDRPTKRPKRKGAATRAKAAASAASPTLSSRPSTELDISIALSEAPPSPASDEEPATLPPASAREPVAAVVSAQPPPLRAAQAPSPTDQQAHARVGRETVQSRTRTRLGMPHDPGASAAPTPDASTEASERRPKTRDLRAVNSLPADGAARRPRTGDHAVAQSEPGTNDAGSPARRPKTGEFAVAQSLPADNAPRRPKTGEFPAAQSTPADNSARRPKTGEVAVSAGNTRDILASPSFIPANDNPGAARRPTTRDILASPSFIPANDNASAARRPTARDILAAPSLPANDNAAAAHKPTARDILAAPVAPVRARTPRGTPSAQQPAFPAVAINTEASQTRKRRWPMWLGLAAVSCAGLAFYGLSMQSGARDSGHAALGSLEQLPALAAQTEPVSPAAPSEARANTPAPRTPDSSPNASASNNSSQSSSAPRPGSRERAPDADTDVGRARALVEEGATLQSQGRLGLAESAYQKALALVPEHPGAMAALVRVHLARRDGAEALRWATRLVAKQPKDAANQLLLGDALSLRGDLDGARDAWTDAAERGNATARQRLQ